MKRLFVVLVLATVLGWAQDATTLQKYNVCADAPAAGNILTWNTAFNCWRPGSASAASAVLGNSNLTTATRVPYVSAAGTLNQSSLVYTAIPHWQKYAFSKIANDGVNCASATVSAAVFTGTGLDDGTSSGTYTGAGDTTYTAIIDGLGLIKGIEGTPTAAGTGYAVNDVLTLTTGDGNATVTVATIGAEGAVTSVSLTTSGTGYSVGAGQATSGGGGTGATIEVTDIGDTFKSQKGAGAFTENRDISGGAQTLGDGVEITFAADNGHTLTDQWVVTVTDIGCWALDGTVLISAETDTSQDVEIAALAAKSFIDALRVKTNTACDGATTINLGVGTADNPVVYRAANYNLKTAVSATNISDTLAATGNTTAAAGTLVFRVVTTVENVADIATGCAVDVWVRSAVLP